MKHIVVRIPTKSYLAQYVHSTYSDPVPASWKNELGCLFFTLSQKKQRISSAHIERIANISDSFIHKGFDSYISFSVPIDYFTRTGCSLNLKEVIVFNNIIKRMFERDLVQWCAMSKNFGVEYKQSIATFFDMHNIEEEHHITYDAIKKMQQRARKKFKHLWGKLSPAC